MKMMVRRKASLYQNPGRPDMWPVRNGNGSQAVVSSTQSSDGNEKKMTIRPEGIEEGITVPYAPRDVSFDGLADTYSQVVRMGQDPLVVREGEGIKTMSFTLFIGTKSGVASVVPLLDKLELYANSDVPLYVSFSSMENGKWHISSMSYRTTMKRPGDHETTQAEVDIEFTRSTGGANGIGPVTGGAGAGSKGGKESGKTIVYEVKKGDSLHSIAVHFFKDASRWKDIAKWNDLKSAAKADLKPGQKLKIKLDDKKGGK